jgi:hypothetical protein
MVRDMEKFLKTECPKGVPKLKGKMIQVVPEIIGLDLINIEPCTEPRTTVHFDLDLDQLEETEE